MGLLEDFTVSINIMPIYISHIISIVPAHTNMFCFVNVPKLSRSSPLGKPSNYRNLHILPIYILFTVLIISPNVALIL